MSDSKLRHTIRLRKDATGEFKFAAQSELKFTVRFQQMQDTTNRASKLPRQFFPYAVSPVQRTLFLLGAQVNSCYLNASMRSHSLRLQTVHWIFQYRAMAVKMTNASNMQRAATVISEAVFPSLDLVAMISTLIYSKSVPGSTSYNSFRNGVEIHKFPNRSLNKLPTNRLSPDCYVMIMYWSNTPAWVEASIWTIFDKEVFARSFCNKSF